MLSMGPTGVPRYYETIHFQCYIRGAANAVFEIVKTLEIAHLRASYENCFGHMVEYHTAVNSNGRP